MHKHRHGDELQLKANQSTEPAATALNAKDPHIAERWFLGVALLVIAAWLGIAQLNEYNRHQKEIEANKPENVHARITTMGIILGQAAVSAQDQCYVQYNTYNLDECNLAALNDQDFRASLVKNDIRGYNTWRQKFYDDCLKLYASGTCGDMEAREIGIARRAKTVEGPGQDTGPDQ